MARKTRSAVKPTTDQFQPRYPGIEKLLESEDFKELNSHYAAAYAELEKVAKQKGLGKAREAKKAMKALERVADLMNHLLKLKYEFIESRQSGEKKPQKKRVETRNSRAVEGR